jgi:hypothetical protein
MNKKIISFIKFLDETATMPSGMNQGGVIPPYTNIPPAKESPAQRRKRIEQEAIAKLTPKALHGLDPNPEHEFAIRNLLMQYSDNPQTKEMEQPTDASWQSINTAQSNYMQQELQKLKAQQGMAH